MKKQTITWTALPNGYTPEGLLKLSVFVSPRLEDTLNAQTTLDGYPDTRGWYTTKPTITFSVQIGAGSPVAATDVSEPPDGTLWEALVDDSTLVRSHVFNGLHGRKIRSYPVRNIVAFLRDRYAEVASSSGTDFPSRTSLLAPGAFGPLRFMDTRGRREREDALIRSNEETLGQLLAIPYTPYAPGSSGFADQIAKDFLQLHRFHRHRNAETTVDGHKTHTRVEPVTPTVDFHQLLGSMASYPFVLRKLGFIVDLEFPLPFRAGPPGHTTIRVIPSWTPALPATTNSTPRTRCFIGTGVFQADPRAVDPELDGGMLPFENTSRFEVVQLDPDGAAEKALNLVDNLARSLITKHHTEDTPDDYSLPSLRSGGLGVARVERATMMVNLLASLPGKNADLLSNTLVLDAEDVLRGHRPHIYDTRTGRWLPLCARRGTYRFTTIAEELTFDDEGWISTATTEAADGSSTDLYLQELLFNWGGWSLFAVRPGRQVNVDDTQPPVQKENTSETPYGLEVSYKARTLPRLRFGRSYRIRAVGVDLAGNDMQPAPDATHATAELMFRRFEPVQSPAIVPRTERTEGESVERMVVRSNYDTPIAAVNERHIAPPKTSQLMAERHGLFDDADGAPLRKSDYALIVARESGSFLFADPPFPPGYATDPHNANQPRYDIDTMGFPRPGMPATVDPVPYLPDPAGIGAAFQGLPGAAGVVRVPFYDADVWPDGHPFRMILREGAAAPFFDAASRRLVVSLPKAHTASVKVSCFVDPRLVDLFGIWGWLLEKGLATFAKRTEIAEGRNWTVTPWRILRLVHAVRQPLVPPQFVKPSISRGYGDTFARLRDTLTISRRSTVRVDVAGAWDEYVDALGEPAPRIVPGGGPVFQVPVQMPDPEHPDGTLPVNDPVLHRHEFGDTKRRIVTYTAVATTRFAEYFTRRTTIAFTPAITHVLLDEDGNASGVVRGSEAVTRGATTFRRGADYTMDYPAGKITRVGTGSIGDDPVEVAYLVPPISRDTSDPAATQPIPVLDVPSSARPAAPKVVYLLPTFGWDREREQPGSGETTFLRSTRHGRGLRVYLERPWWSSGVGELLGVLVAPSSPSDTLKPYVTQWGTDPIWLTSATKALPALGDFPAATITRTGVTLDELSGPLVNVAGHEVYKPGETDFGYDHDRKLWYCDLEVDAGSSYMPFVRLALVRFQPWSVANAHISRVVLADFMQLTPDRTATLVFDPRDTASVTVSVSGLSYTAPGPGAGSGRSRVFVTVEERNPSVPDEDLGWQPASDPVELGAGGRFGTWTGTVQLPGPRGSARYRLVIREFEVYTGSGSAITGTAQRMTYAEQVEI